MSDEIKNDVPEKVSLVIEWTKDGKINVSGPITNEMLSFYLLERAKDIIKAHNLQLAFKANQSKIVPAHGIVDFVRGKRF